MKIASTDLGLHARNVATQRSQTTETLRAWRGERPNFAATENRSPLASAFADISGAGRRLLEQMPPAGSVSPASTSREAGAVDADSTEIDNDPVISMIRHMIELFTGEKVRVFDMSAFAAELRHVEARSSSTTSALETAPDGRAGFGVEYDQNTVREEFEATQFSAEGVVHTTDGKEIRFRLDLEMTRYYREESQVEVRAGDAVRKDPLVVNFGGTAAQLESAAGRRFRFDLDGDGRVENLPLLGAGSAYLVFDLNHDGRIEAKELFGPQSGNGFTELARLDSDGNGWIDAADPDFDELALWRPATEGNGTLQALGDAGIGALALAHLATPFELRGENNADLGAVKSGGVFITESGKAGSLQEIDLTV